MVMSQQHEDMQTLHETRICCWWRLIIITTTDMQLLLLPSKCNTQDMRWLLDKSKVVNYRQLQLPDSSVVHMPTYKFG